jgi:hypothetical protein
MSKKVNIFFKMAIRRSTCTNNVTSINPVPQSSAKLTASIQLNLSYLTFKGALKYGSIRQVVTKYRLN